MFLVIAVHIANMPCPEMTVEFLQQDGKTFQNMHPGFGAQSSFFRGRRFIYKIKIYLAKLASYSAIFSNISSMWAGLILTRLILLLGRFILPVVRL